MQHAPYIIIKGISPTSPMARGLEPTADLQPRHHYLAITHEAMGHWILNRGLASAQVKCKFSQQRPNLVALGFANSELPSNLPHRCSVLVDTQQQPTTREGSGACCINDLCCSRQSFQNFQTAVSFASKGSWRKAQLCFHVHWGPLRHGVLL